MVCEVCGGIGQSYHHVVCNDCDLATVHIYCLKGPVNGQRDVKWKCARCRIAGGNTSKVFLSHVPKSSILNPNTNAEETTKRDLKDTGACLPKILKSPTSKLSQNRERSVKECNIVGKSDDKGTINSRVSNDRKETNLDKIRSIGSKSECEAPVKIHKEGEKKRKLILEESSDEEADPVCVKTKTYAKQSHVLGKTPSKQPKTYEETPTRNLHVKESEASAKTRKLCEKKQPAKSSTQCEKKRKLVLGDSSDEEAEPVNAEQNLVLRKTSLEQPETNAGAQTVNGNGHVEECETSGRRSSGPGEQLTLPKSLIKPVASDSLSPRESPESESPNVKPIQDPVWWGTFEVIGYKLGELEVMGHVSTHACVKVSEFAGSSMPRRLRLEVHDRPNIWPKTLTGLLPNHENIALYFFPRSESDKFVYSQLVIEINTSDKGLKASFSGVELLVFSSCILPEELQRYRGRRYLWGTFKESKAGNSAMAMTAECTAGISAEKISSAEQSSLSELDDIDQQSKEEIAASAVSSHVAEVKTHHPQDEVVSQSQPESPQVHKHAKQCSQVDVINPPREDSGKKDSVESGEIPPLSFDDLEVEGKHTREQRKEEDSVGSAYARYGSDSCLPLFPVNGEDLAISTKYGNCAIDLDLRLHRVPTDKVVVGFKGDLR